MDKITIRPDMIFLHGVTTQKGLCNTEFIVFSENGTIAVTGEQNGFRKDKEGNILVYPSYTRKIADSFEEYRIKTIDKIECQAYNAWMSGAKG